MFSANDGELRTEGVYSKYIRPSHGVSRTRTEGKKTINQRLPKNEGGLAAALHLKSSGRSLMRTAAAGAAAASAAGFRQRHRGFHGEAHLAHINFDALYPGQQILVEAEGKAALFLRLILII